MHPEDEYDEYIRNVRAANRMMWDGLAACGIGLILGLLLGWLFF